MKIFLLFIFYLFFNQTAFAYNSEKCEKMARDHSIFGRLMSTTSYASSTGECSLLAGSGVDKKKQFMMDNADEFMFDAARGEGENLEAYAELSGCKSSATEYFGKTIQKNFNSIYGKNKGKDPLEIYSKIENIMTSDPTLKKACTQN